MRIKGTVAVTRICDFELNVADTCTEEEIKGEFIREAIKLQYTFPTQYQVVKLGGLNVSGPQKDQGSRL